MDSSTDSHEQDENTTEEGGQENPDSGTSLTDSGSLEADSADCVDECEIDGERACHEDGIRTCGHYDTDSCLEWSPVEACPEQQTCDPSTVTCQEDEGEPLAPFSIILIPDPQNYTGLKNDANNPYRKQTQWIADHWVSDRIQTVIHLGDNTNNNKKSEWAVGDAAFDTLDKAGRRYSMTTGNHDYRVDGVFKRNGSLFDNYFGKSRFEGKPWYGDSYGNSNINNYTKFEVGTMKFLVLSLEFAPRKEVLEWGSKVIGNHPDHHVIIATHCYLTHDGKYSSCKASDKVVGSSGDTTFKELAARHSNVFLVVSGHINDSEYRMAKGNNGNPVHQMVVDYQMEKPCAEAKAANCKNHCRSGGHTGNGWLRKLIFDPVNHSVQAETFSVEEGNHKVFPGGKPTLFCSELFKPPSADAKGDNWYASNPHHADHQFHFDFDMTAPIQYSYK